MVPLYAARIEYLGPGDFVKIDCASCSHTALLSMVFLDRLGLRPQEKILDLKESVRCCGSGAPWPIRDRTPWARYERLSRAIRTSAT